MQFTLFALASLLAVALASPIAMPAPASGDVAAPRVVRRGDSEPAMSDASGNVIPFDANAVTLPMAASGQ